MIERIDWNHYPSNTGQPQNPVKSRCPGIPDVERTQRRANVSLCFPESTPRSQVIHKWSGYASERGGRFVTGVYWIVLL